VQGGRERGIGGQEVQNPDSCTRDAERTGPPFFNSKSKVLTNSSTRHAERTGPPFFNSKWFPIASELEQAAEQGGRERGIGQEVQNPDKQQHQARRAYQRARTGSSGSYSAVQGGRKRGIGQEVQSPDKQQHQAERTGPPFFYSKWFPIASELEH
jgi:hypothetical protein